ncbi:MAG: ATP-binding protein [Planctomycetota bacterium]|nr:ATP-binding protein [Planctomycetota bacterium]
MKPDPRPLEAELVFPSSPEYLSLVRSNVQWITERCKFPEKEASRIVLAVVEAVTNIIRHAYHGDNERKITMRLTEIPCGLQLEFLDRGEPVPPQKIKGRSLDEVKPGGLGVHMLASCMDDVRYEERPGGGTRLVLKKFRVGEEEQ